jgi:hypothetical protein
VFVETFEQHLHGLDGFLPASARRNRLSAAWLAASNSFSSLRVPDFEMSIAGQIRPLGESAIQNNLEISCSFELLKDHFVHLAAGVDESVPMM